MNNTKKNKQNVNQIVTTSENSYVIKEVKLGFEILPITSLLQW